MKNKFGYFIVIIISLFVGCICTLIVLNNYGLLNKKEEKINKTIKEVNIKEDNTISSSIDKIYDAVVVVQTYSNDKLTGTGTGFYYKKDEENGYIITNHHVIEDGKTITIIDNNDTEYNAEILGSDEYLDIAVLKVDSKRQRLCLLQQF